MEVIYFYAFYVCLENFNPNLSDIVFSISLVTNEIAFIYKSTKLGLVYLKYIDRSTFSQN